MDFEVYCDESRQDTFIHPTDNSFLLIGSLWLPASERERLKTDIKELRDRHSLNGEMKWQKVSPRNIPFYKELIDLFLAYGNLLRFRCIAVPSNRVNFVKYHENDRELGFYKFYYQMLHHWLLDFNTYSIFCDIKTNRKRDQLATLKRCLALSNLTSTVCCVQALPSHEQVAIQVTDILLGAASSRLNHSVAPGGAKDLVIRHLERGLGVRELRGTSQHEEKFNIFHMRLEGGW